MERHDDNIWESDSDEDGQCNAKIFDNNRYMAKRDWERVESGVEKDGFRNGRAADNEDIIQNGFNAAFKQAFQMASAAGMFHGETCAMLQGIQASQQEGNLAVSVSPSQLEDDAVQPELQNPAEFAKNLERVNENVATLISNIPDRLCPKDDDSNDAADSRQGCGCESNLCEEETRVKGDDKCGDSQTTDKFFDDLNHLRTSVHLIQNS